MTDRPKFMLKADKTISPPWEFPKRVLPAGTIVYLSPANNLPGSDPGYWVKHPDITDSDYGVLVDRAIDVYELCE